MKTQEEIDKLMRENPRSLKYEDIPPEQQQAAADNLGDIACLILKAPRGRLKEVRHFSATELGNKTGIEFVFDPELTEEESEILNRGLDLLNAMAGGRPIIRPKG
jgi:hypothetical protein